MSCSSCQSIKLDIKLPADLKRAIKLADQKVHDGTLSYLGIGDYGTTFRFMPTRFDWGDFVHNYFRCTACEQLFRLWAETYHGSGGGFQPVDSVDGSLTPEAYP